MLEIKMQLDTRQEEEMLLQIISETECRFHNTENCYLFKELRNNSAPYDHCEWPLKATGPWKVLAPGRGIMLIKQRGSIHVAHETDASSKLLLFQDSVWAEKNKMEKTPSIMQKFQAPSFPGSTDI